MAVGNPQDWPDDQRRFRLAYLDDPTPFPRRPVELVWVTRPESSWSADVLTGRHEGVEVTVTELDGDHRSLRFAVAADQVPPRQGGRVPGVLVGGWGPNATLCVEVDDGVVWPIYNPEAVTSRTAQRTRADARQLRTRPARFTPPARWQAASLGARVLLTVGAAAGLIAIRLGIHWLFTDQPPGWLEVFRWFAILALIIGGWLWRLHRDDAGPPGS